MKCLSFLLILAFYKAKNPKRVDPQVKEALRGNRENFQGYVNNNIRNGVEDGEKGYFEHSTICDKKGCKNYRKKCDGDNCNDKKYKYRRDDLN